MSDVTVRELSRETKAILARVKAGEVLTVTESGRPVAVLSGLSDGGSLPRRAPRPAAPPPAVQAPPACPSDPLGQLRWLQAAQLRAVEIATDERTRTQAAKEARALTEKIGRITGELAEIDAGELSRYERMQPAELLEAIEAMAEDLREAIRG